MNPRRILKMSTALMGGQGVNLLNQFLLPPLFLRSYGIVSYGEWLTLSATVSYLGTLNFGLQTYANNQAGIAHNRGEQDEVQTIQATALLILISIVLCAAALTSVVFLLPLGSWLKLAIPNGETALITYLMGLQILSRMLFGFFGGCFLVAGAAHRGQNWGNLQTLTTLIVTAGAVAAHSKFTLIAALQLGLIFVFTCAALIDLKRLAPGAVPRLRHAERARIREILKPSGYFAMLFSSNFLVYQFPVLAMSRILGAEKVVVFSLTRTIYSMSRTFLNSLSQAMGPEIVELYGQRSWAQLHRLYDLSERAVFALTPVVSLGTFALTPFLMGLWLHKPQLYDARTCFFMALISGVMGVKEHKYVFQTSANEHSEMARFVFFSYAAMVALLLPGISWFGSAGFLLLWLATESVQLAYILRLNQRLFAESVQLNVAQVYRVVGLLAATAAACFASTTVYSGWKDVRGAGLSLAAIALSAAVGYSAFGIGELREGLAARVMRR